MIKVFPQREKKGSAISQWQCLSNFGKFCRLNFAVSHFQCPFSWDKILQCYLTLEVSVQYGSRFRNFASLMNFWSVSEIKRNLPISLFCHSSFLHLFCKPLIHGVHKWRIWTFASTRENIQNFSISFSEISCFYLIPRGGYFENFYGGVPLFLFQA